MSSRKVALFVVLIGVVSLLVWMLRRDEPTGRTTRPGTPVATGKGGAGAAPEPAAKKAAKLVRRKLPLDPDVEIPTGLRVFVQPVEHRSASEDDPPREAVPASNTELIKDWQTSLEVAIEEDVVFAKVLLLAPGCLPVVLEWYPGGESEGADEDEAATLDAEFERGKPTVIEAVDEDGNPIAGAEVFVYAGYVFPPHERLVTGADGKVSVLLNEHGHVYATAPGRTREKGTPERRRVVLSPAFGMAGRVVDSAGNGVGGVAISLKEGVSDVIRSGFFARTQSAADGAFRFEHVSAGDCELHATKAGYLTASYIGWPGDDAVVMKMFRPATLSGRVVGKDMAGKEVDGRLTREIYAQTEGGRVAKDGSFLVRVEPGRLTLEVWDSDSIGTLPVEVREGEVRGGLVISMRPKQSDCEVSLLVLGPDGEPRPGVVVWTGETPRVRTDDQGAVTVPYPGEDFDDVGVHLEPPGMPPHTARVFCRARSTKHVSVVRLPAPVDVTIRVVPKEADVELSCSPWKMDRWEDAGRSDPYGGVYAFRLDPELEYTLKVTDDGGEYTRKWTVPPERAVTIHTKDLRPGSARLRFLDGGGHPLTDVWVRARDAKNRLHVATLQEDGSYVFDSLAPGAARVGAGRDYNVPEARFDLAIVGEEECRPNPTVLGGYRLLRGFVRDERGRPVGGASLEFDGQWGRPGFADGAATASRPDGGFAMRVARDGAAGIIIVSKEGFGEMALDSRAEDPTIALPPAGSLELDVPAEMQEIEIERTVPLAGGGNVVLSRREWVAWGRLRFERLAPGTLRLRLPGVEKTFEIRAGETTRASIR